MAYISYDGHSACRIKDNIIVWIDPFYEGNPMSKRSWQELEAPDVVLVTHSHKDHLGQAIEIVQETNAKLGCILELAQWFRSQGVLEENILNNGKGWNMGGTVSYKNTLFTMYPSCHTSAYGMPVGFVVKTNNNFTCYHAGDTSLFSDMRLIGEMHSIDVAFLPIGDVFTMNPEQGARAARLLGTQYAIPIHFKTFPELVQDATEFCSHLGRFAPHCKSIVLEPGETVIL